MMETKADYDSRRRSQPAQHSILSNSFVLLHCSISRRRHLQFDTTSHQPKHPPMLRVTWSLLHLLQFGGYVSRDSIFVRI